jgi:hypothetical protein
MAAGDINSRKTTNLGGNKVVFGQIDVDTTARAFAIADTTNPILFASVISEIGPHAVSCVINSNDGTEGTAMGSIYVDCAGDVNAQYFCVMAAG